MLREYDYLKQWFLPERRKAGGYSTGAGCDVSNVWFSGSL